MATPPSGEKTRRAVVRTWRSIMGQGKIFPLPPGCLGRLETPRRLAERDYVDGPRATNQIDN